MGRAEPLQHLGHEHNAFFLFFLFFLLFNPALFCNLFLVQTIFAELENGHKNTLQYGGAVHKVSCHFEMFIIMFVFKCSALSAAGPLFKF